MTTNLDALPLGKTVRAAYVLTKLLTHRIDVRAAHAVPSADQDVLDAVLRTVAELEQTEGVRLPDFSPERVADYVARFDHLVSTRVLSETPLRPGDENLMVAVRAPLRSTR